MELDKCVQWMYGYVHTNIWRDSWRSITQRSWFQFQANKIPMIHTLKQELHKLTQDVEIKSCAPNYFNVFVFSSAQ